MSLLQMSFSGAVLILAVLIVRALTIRRLPKDTFLVLWGIVLLRLLVPFSVASAASVYSWGNEIWPWMSPDLDSSAGWNAAGQNRAGSAAELDDDISMNVSVSAYPAAAVKNTLPVSDGAHTVRDTSAESARQVHLGTDRTAESARQVHLGAVRAAESVWRIVWCLGMSVSAICFAVSYLRCRVEFQASLPVESPRAQAWISEHSRRPVCIRQSDRISTPLTYGIWRPVILMPKGTDWENAPQLRYVLAHECVHICRFDALTKLVCAGALCVHWFNPLVWIMYVLFNRDVEISCDEHVVRRFGETSKSAYAKMLIQMEAQRSQGTPYLPLGSSLLPRIGKNAMEERIWAIMKIKKKSLPAVLLAAVLVISVTVIFATSAVEKTESQNPALPEEISGTDFTQEEWQKLGALQFEGYENMSVSSFQHKVWSCTDTAEYRSLLERFSLDKTLFARYQELGQGTDEKADDSSASLRFLYNILDPLTAEQWQTRSFDGYAATDFPGASDNALLEYEVTLTILDADLLTVRAYDTARQRVMDRLKTIFQTELDGLLVSELRDEELMRTLLDETIGGITAAWSDDRLQVAAVYHYSPLGEVPVDKTAPWEQEQRAEIDAQMAQFVPFGLTYKYDAGTLELSFAGREVRGIYDTVQGLFISAHGGIGEGVYGKDAIDLYAVYDGRKLTGLREATPQEMEEITQRRQAATDAYKKAYPELFLQLREEIPATEEDYRSLLALKTPDYQSKSIAEFNMELLDWANENHAGMERIGVDNLLGDRRVTLTDEEREFAAVTAHLSRMENTAYVTSLQKNEPERDVVEEIYLRDKEEYSENSYGMAWCSLYYVYSYHISDKETVRVGERDDCVSGMLESIQSYWEASTVDQMTQMTEEELQETLHAIAEKYSTRNVTLTILDDQTRFSCMDDRYLR